ncbi:Pleckstrin homology domain-containing family M member 3 [Echinococcus granulosus]|nr:Pleckstrin homology domain-containing family M member 3 [Echinococcus granulosus]
MEFKPSGRPSPFRECRNTSSSSVKISTQGLKQDSCRGNVPYFTDPFFSSMLEHSLQSVNWRSTCCSASICISPLGKNHKLTKNSFSSDSSNCEDSCIFTTPTPKGERESTIVDKTASSSAASPTASPVSAAQGHTFRIIPSLRLLGTVCDSCVRSVKSPTGSVLLCRDCSVTCHDSPACLRGLLRVCPASSASSTLILEVAKGAHLDASLSRQGWRCWSCRTPLRAPLGPPSTVANMPLLLRNLSTASASPSAELLLSVQRMEHASTPAEAKLKCATTALQEVAGLFSPQLGPLLTSADVRIAVADGFVQQAALAVGKGTGEGETSAARFCHYSGKFFCANCHWGDLWCIPGKVFALGITSPYPVSRDSLIALEYMWPRQQFSSPEPWQRWNGQAVLTGSLRMRAHRLLFTYFRVCREAAALLHKFEESQPAWLLERPCTYTMWTVERVLDGSLIELLMKFLAQVEKHVNACMLCMTLGHSICLVCRKSCPQPHHHCSAVCSVCHNVVHRSCLVPPLKANFDDLRPVLEILQLQRDCPAALKIEDILESHHPSTEPTRCKLCCD